MSLYLGDAPISNTGLSKANTDLNNLTSTGANIANWSNNVTNCITEIPQNIKLELNNGTLTLKAGSKLCVPNGFEQDGTTPHFDFVTLASDITQNYGTGRIGCLVVVSNNAFEWSTTDDFTSGTTQPASSWWVWYDRTTNKIKFYNGSTTVEGVCFPIAIITENAGSGLGSGIKSIDQVFNGFGYIGSTVFALPDVKGLIPNGRNADGSLKNIEFETSSVLTITMSGNWTDQLSINLKGSALYTTSTTKYYEDENKVIDSDGYASDTAFIGSLYYNNGDISNFIPKTAFHALDYNDRTVIAHNAMPSGTIINGIFTSPITTTGQTYTAPADGYVMVGANLGSNKALEIDVDDRPRFYQYSAAGHSFGNYTPVRKGQTVKVFVSYGGGSATLENSYFEYAVGTV